MPYKINLEIEVTVMNYRDCWKVSANTPYGYIYGKKGTLSQAIEAFDYQYVMAKERKERENEMSNM